MIDRFVADLQKDYSDATAGHIPPHRSESSSILSVENRDGAPYANRTSTPMPRRPEQSRGERKTVMALFADFKRSTELMAELDSEEASAIIDPALRLMIDTVHRYDGYVV